MNTHARWKRGRLVGLMATLAVVVAVFHARPAQAQQPEPSTGLLPQPADLPAPVPAAPLSTGDLSSDVSPVESPDGSPAPSMVAAVSPRAFLPIVSRPPIPLPTPPADKNDTQAYINYFRALAGAPPISLDAALNNNCWLHARYMAENNVLTHQEDPGNPWYTPQGQVCAGNGNVWMGGAFYQPYWQPYHAIDGWMGSVGHRLWLLYPTTPVFGFGFYTAANNRAAAGLDVLSRFNSAADTSYPNWPVRYPAAGQTDVPPAVYAVTIFWRYWGPAPTLTSASLRTADGAAVAHTATTNLEAGHKGVKITPSAALARNTAYVVSVSGTYNGAPFSYTWSFRTSP